jgi:hypothetical protein
VLYRPVKAPRKNPDPDRPTHNFLFLAPVFFAALFLARAQFSVILLLAGADYFTSPS